MVGIEPTTFGILSHILNRPDRVAQLAENWASIPKVVGWIFFKPARCGYTLRVTSQASFSLEYTTPTRQIS